MRFTFFFSVMLVLVLILAAFAAGQSVPQPAPPNAAGTTLPAAPLPAPRTPTPQEEMQWSNLQQLNHDQPIRIYANGGRDQSCLFTGATGSMLFCEPAYANRPGLEYRFDRADVENIRLDQTHRNMHRALVIPTIAGAVAGVIFGAVADNRNNCPSGLCEIVGGAIGAFTGGLAGIVIALPAGLLIPGKRIYHREHHASAHRSTHPSPVHIGPAPNVP